MTNGWSDPQTILALVKLGADLTPTVVTLLKKPPQPQKLEPVNLEYLLSIGYSMDEATLIMAEFMQAQT